MDLKALLNQDKLRLHRTSKKEIENLLTLIKRDIKDAKLEGLSSDRKFATAISFHCHGEIIIYPWAYKDADTPHHSVFLEMSEEMAKHNGYAYGNPNSGLIYNCNGEFTDYMYGTLETLAFTYELGTVFIPPPNQVQGICKANAEAAFIITKYAKNPCALFESHPAVLFDTVD